jgi:membrane-associated phospholipid phosphatase
MAALLAAGPSSAQDSPSFGGPPPPVPEAPRASDTSRSTLTWDPRWRPVDGYDYAVSGALAFGSLAALAIPSRPTSWAFPGGFDKSVRDALRFNSQTARNNARDLSDAFLTTSVNWLAVDALAVTWWGHDRRAIAWELVSMDAEALAVTSFVQGMTAGLVSRQRPFYPTCVGPFNDQTTDCRSNNRYRSFFSGHTSLTFTAAGLICQHHAHLPLYGGGAPDVIACIASIGLAGATGYLRIASDQHYLTDVMTGAAVGSLSGFLVPWLFHYRVRSSGTPPFAAALPGGGFVSLTPTPNGAGVGGVF